jgi:hypothetical protein
MKQITDFKNSVSEHCDFDLELDQNNECYKFKKIYVDEVNCELFNYEIEKLTNSLIDILENIKKPETLIKETKQILAPFINWFEDDELFDFNFFHKLNTTIVQTSGNDKFDKKYTLDDLNNLPHDLRNHEDLDDIILYLILGKSKTNNYKHEEDFEKMKLHYVLTKWYESLKGFMAYLENIEYGITQYGVEYFSTLRLIKTPSPRCIINLNKLEVATLFDALFRSSLFRFDFSSQVKKEKALCEFLDKNFCYVSRRNEIVPINNIAKEFGSLSKHANIGRQKEIIDFLIDHLNEIKENLNKH